MMAAGQSVLIVGPVTWDRVDGRDIAGGTVSYAARVATAMGVRAHILTTADATADLSALEGHTVHLVPASRTLTLEHRFDETGRRHQRVIARPGHTLTADDLPAGWPSPDVLVLAPLLDDSLEPRGFDALPFRDCALTGQGLLRQVGASGAISDAREPTTALDHAITARTSLFLSEEEVRAWPHGALEALAARARRVVLTRGMHGAEIIACGQRRSVPPVPAQPVDTTGAGDVFATAFILAIGEGEATAGRLAAAFAAAAVEVWGAGPLPARATIEERLEPRLGDTPWRS